MQRARWFVVVGSLSAGLAFLPLAGFLVRRPIRLVSSKRRPKSRRKKLCEVKLADAGLNAETFKNSRAKKRSSTSYGAT